MKQPDVNKLAEHYSAILQEIGADPRSERVRETSMVNRENTRIDGGAHAGAQW
jgi:hypothetical protein